MELDDCDQVNIHGSWELGLDGYATTEGVLSASIPEGIYISL